MASFPTALRILGITGAAWLSGNIACVSLNPVPALVKAKTKDGVTATTLAKQWRYIYDNGKAQNPPIAIATATAFAYLAWSARHTGPKNHALLYGAAAAFTVAIVPFTFIAMSRTNNNLMKKSEGGSSSTLRAVEDEVDKLLSTWSSLNMIRSLFPLTAAVLGLLTVL